MGPEGERALLEGRIRGSMEREEKSVSQRANEKSWDNGGKEKERNS